MSRMIDLSKVDIHQMVVHKVGNKSRDEGVRISQTRYEVPSEEVRDTLLKYFLTSFKFDMFYRFHHETDLSMNEVYTYASRMFDQPNTFHEQSVHILNHLYEQSSHPQIKSGELYVVHLNNILYNDFSIDAIGLFKSENKDVYLKLDEPNMDDLGLLIEEGVNVRKLDKGCLILNVKAVGGFVVGVVDATAGKTQDAAMYWMEDFLNVTFMEDENYYTDHAIQMVNEFYDNVIAPASEQPEKKEKLEFINSTMEYFSRTDKFEEEEFIHNVLQDHNQGEMFKVYKESYTEMNELPPFDAMPISQTALKKAKKTLRNVIKTDTGVELKLKSESFPYVERGYDEERKLHYYKVYFSQEE